jgi:oligopeptide/dipeptide ABC transporter ATP-binding protein
MRAIRGNDISMIFQEPMTSLNPVLTIGRQIAEPLRLHQGLSRESVEQRVVEMLGLVGIAEPRRRAREYPHQLSGGMRQRVMIAIALACRPKLLIADEPTTALDVTVQAQVLQMINRLQQEFGTAVIMITHDLGVIADVADDVVVMYGGMIMEQADRMTIFRSFHHPYTEGLLQSLPAYGGERERLRAIPGTPPSPINVPPGCPFAARCPYVMDRCRSQLPTLEVAHEEPSHLSRCWLPHNATARQALRVGLDQSLSVSAEA